MFTITKCQTHGTREVADLASLAAYVAVSGACRREVSNDPRGHRDMHTAEGTDCWTCCPDMVLDPNNILPTLANL